MPTAAGELRRSVSTIPWIVYWFMLRSVDDQLFSVSTSSHQLLGLVMSWEVAYAIERVASLQPIAQAAFCSAEPWIEADFARHPLVVYWPSTCVYRGS